MYTWKILIGLVDNPGIEFQYSERRGTMAKLPELHQSSKLREASFMIRGPKIFNALPKNIRDFRPTEGNETQWKNGFKKQLDLFLATVPDQANISSSHSARIGVTNQEGKKSNSLLDVIRQKL